jgi:hypothetical protein
MRLGTDSGDYHVLLNAAKQVSWTPGIILELGVREGGGLQWMIDGLISTDNKNRVVVGLDPYGDLPYEWQEGAIAGWTYSNEMKNRAIAGLHSYVMDKPVNLVMMNLTDTEYFTRFADGLPVYMNGKAEIINQYALVHFDGPHNLKDIDNEMEFFFTRTPIDGIWVFDDVTGFYDHDAVEKRLFNTGFEVIEKTAKKASYRRTW